MFAGVGASVVVAMLLAISANCDVISMRFDVRDTAVPMYGVVVGDLVFSNASDDSVAVVEPITLLGSTLSIRIKDPLGSERELGNLGLDLGVTPIVIIAPKGEVRFPICLMSKDGSYFFGREGVHHLAAKCRLHLDWERSGRHRADSSTSIVVDAAPVAISVGPVGEGVEVFRAENDRRSVWRAFRGAFSASSSMADYGDYAREEAKLLLYQQGSAELGRLLNSGEVDEVAGKLGIRSKLDMAQEFQIGVEMWSWIAGQLANPTCFRKEHGWPVVVGGYTIQH